MTVEQKKHQLARYRIKQAEESLEEAEFLLLGRKSPRSVINRAYYAMFYAVLALLVNIKDLMDLLEGISKKKDIWEV